MKYIALLAALTLAACGADGEPTKPGVAVTGEAQMGVTNAPASN